jgi:hypothetical protein
MKLIGNLDQINYLRNELEICITRKMMHRYLLVA